MNETTSGPLPTTRIWDLPTRLLHWLLAAAVGASAATGFITGITALAWHLIAGAIVSAAILARVVWGLLGPPYARFTGFAYRPAAVLAHLRALVHGAHHRYRGHNPLGAMMVFALLGVLAVVALTGLASLGGLLKQGPLRALLSYATGTQALWLHNRYRLAILLLAMIAAHIAGVTFESWRGRENLTAAMLTGNKPSRPAIDSPPSVQPHPRAALATTLATLALSATAIAALAALPGRGVPPATQDPVFAEQCGACHLAYPPSLAPESTWTAILADLPHHFGADASLAPDQVAQIRGFLTANAAGHWDTLPAHLLRTPAPDGSLRITATPGWRRQHWAIAPAVFTAAPVYRPGNCAACHADAATGQFAPQQITIPPR